MNATAYGPTGLRILVIDDDRAIHADIRRVLAPPRSGGGDLASLEALLFDDEPVASAASDMPACEVLSEYQGEDAVDRVEQELGHGRRFDLAIVDMRMPPGWDGLRTVEELWKLDDSLPVAFCTAYSDHSVDHVAARLRRSDVPWLSKPFHSEKLKDIVRKHARGRSRTP